MKQNSGLEHVLKEVADRYLEIGGDTVLHGHAARLATCAAADGLAAAVTAAGLARDAAISARDASRAAVVEKATDAARKARLEALAAAAERDADAADREFALREVKRLQAEKDALVAADGGFAGKDGDDAVLSDEPEDPAVLKDLRSALAELPDANEPEERAAVLDRLADAINKAGAPPPHGLVESASAPAVLADGSVAGGSLAGVPAPPPVSRGLAASASAPVIGRATAEYLATGQFDSRLPGPSLLPARRVDSAKARVREARRVYRRRALARRELPIRGTVRADPTPETASFLEELGLATDGAVRYLDPIVDDYDPGRLPGGVT